MGKFRSACRNGMFASLTGLLLGPLSSAASPLDPIIMSAKDRASCFAARGKIVRLNLRRDETCALPMADASKSCTDGRQCQAGKCFAGPLEQGKYGVWEKERKASARLQTSREILTR